MPTAVRNARTWRFVPQASAAKKAEETLKIYAPLAQPPGPGTRSSGSWRTSPFAAMSPEIYAEMVHGRRTHPALEKFLNEAHQDYGASERRGHRRDQ